jgi:hypothetical protein
MESNTRSKQREILPILCHFGKRTGIQFCWVTSYSKRQAYQILHSNSFGLSLINLVFKNFADAWHPDRSVSVSYRQTKNLFSKALNQFLKINLF